MSYFTFKFNASYKAVEMFKNDYDALIEEIVTALTFALPLDKIDGEIDKEGLLKIEIGTFQKENKKDFEQRFQEISQSTEKLYNEYIDVINKYKKDGSVFYTPEFLSLNKKCSNRRNELERDYPFLKRAENISDEVVLKKYEIPTETSVGTAITHIKKFYKMKIFLQNRNLDELLYNTPNIYFYAKKELVLIETENVSDALNTSRELTRKLNADSIVNERLGKITILPIYKEILIDKNIKGIRYSIVYPNGAKKAHESIMEHLKVVEGEIMDVEIESSKSLNYKELSSSLTELGADGYLSNIESDSKDKIHTEHQVIDDINQLEVWNGE